MRKLVPAITIAAALVVLGSTAALSWQGATLAAETAGPGDEVRLNLALFDVGGNLLFSTRLADRPALSAVKAAWEGPFVVPDVTEDEPVKHVLGDGFAPALIAPNITLPIGASLMGKSVGFKTVLPVVGRYDGYTKDVVLERSRGPFNLTLATTEATLRNATTSADGDDLVLQNVLPARVVAREGDRAWVRLDVADGDELPVNRTTLVARVAMNDDESFSLILDAEPGSMFSLSSACAAASTVLAPGSYVVESVTEEEVTLKHSSTRAPQLMGRDLVAGIEIVSIGGNEE